LNTINDPPLLKALYHTILYAKTRKQAHEAFGSAPGNGKKIK
jgi:hypothetical protein